MSFPDTTFTTGTTITSNWLNAVNDKVQETVSVKDFGAVGDGVTDDTAAIQTALDQIASTGGILLFPEGNYLISDDISLYGGGDLPLNGMRASVLIDGYAARFTGNYKFILDSVKNVTLSGFMAQTVKLTFRGVWWSNIVDCKFDQLLVGDTTGTQFTECYWNSFNNCVFGNITLDHNRLYFNSNVFNGCSIRSSSGQGFLNNYDYNIVIQGSYLCQEMTFNSCDLSYAAVDVVYVNPANPRNDNSLNFNQCYFDSTPPKPKLNLLITTNNCITAGGPTVFGLTADVASLAKLDNFGSEVFSYNNPYSGYNLAHDGNFLTGKNTGIVAGTSTTYFTSGGVAGGGLVRVQSSGTPACYVYADRPIPGYYSGSFYITNWNVGSQQLIVSLGGIYRTITVTYGTWTYVSNASNTLQTETGVNKSFATLYAPDGSNIDIAISGVSYTLGRTGSLLSSPDITAIKTFAPTRAWCTFNGNGVTPTFRDTGFNISNITKVGTGDYLVYFNNYMTNTSYMVLFGNQAVNESIYVVARELNYVRINTYVSGSLTDCDFIGVAIYSSN